MSSVAGGRVARKFIDKKKRKRTKETPLQRYISLRGTPNGVHEFKKTAWANFNVSNTGIQIPGGGTYQTDFVMRFDLNNVVFIGAGSTTVPMPGIAELATLFDRIKLNKVIVRFRSRNDSGPILGGAQNFAVQIGTALDYNDDDVATSATLREYGTFKDDCIQPGGKEHMRVLKPCYLIRATDDDGIGVAFDSKRGYVNSASSCRHYGLKGTISGGNNVSDLWVAIEYHYQCRNSR